MRCQNHEHESDDHGRANFHVPVHRELIVLLQQKWYVLIWHPVEVDELDDQARVDEGHPEHVYCACVDLLRLRLVPVILCHDSQNGLRDEVNHNDA